MAGGRAEIPAYATMLPIRGIPTSDCYQIQKNIVMKG
jgi:hypothetical protein